MDRAGVILKKCDRRFHKPGTNRACTAGTCQHTCDRPGKCPHAWTLRYFANGKQRRRDAGWQWGIEGEPSHQTTPGETALFLG